VLPVTLEQLYAGKTKKMAVKRDVVDKENEVSRCSACDGQGIRLQTLQRGGMIQQSSVPCSSCKQTGHIFKHKQCREELQVHIQKGALDGHKVVFREKADELPGAETGDVVFVLKQNDHKEFKRRGADLYIQRTISLSEALCGFQLEVTHLDGRKLLIKSSPGEVMKPMPQGFDPLKFDDDATTWERVEGVDCPDIDSVAEAREVDVEQLKKACEGQLKRRGVDVSAFVVDHRSGKAFFKSACREDVMKAQMPNQNCTMYVVADPDAESRMRMMKAVKGEGMPTLKNPFVHGNLFIIFNIEFPQSLSCDAQDQLRTLLPPPINTSTSATDEDVEVHEVTNIDPVQSYSANRDNMTVTGEAYDEDEDEEATRQPACTQM